MTRFIPIILASAIFFACSSEPQKQTEEQPNVSTEMIENKAQPTAVTVAQQETDMEMDEQEQSIAKGMIEDSPIQEKVNTNPTIKEEVSMEKKEEKVIRDEADRLEMKKEEKAEVTHEEVMDNMPKATEEMIDKKEEMPTDEIAKSTEKEMTETEAKVEATTPKIMIPTHQNWDQLVRKYISSTGKVNYKGFKADKAKLEAYLQELANNPPQSDWKRNEAMAYWINAYNANTIKLIVDNYPVKSIMDLYGRKAFDRKWIKIGDQTYSLNNIENDILRPRYKDARIHFAVNCAAMSCPPIHNRAWTATNLNSTLQAKAKAFVNNAQYNAISKGSVEISKIFEWYSGDFGNIITYLNKYAATEIKDNAKVSYKEYDWALNQ